MVGTDSHTVTCRVVLGVPVSRLLILDTRLSLSLVSLSRLFSYQQPILCPGPTTPADSAGLACSLFARRYLGNIPDLIGAVFFSSPYLDVSVREVGLTANYEFISRIPRKTGAGYPIRKPTDKACKRATRRYRPRSTVLPRQNLPRHPPMAL